MTDTIALAIRKGKTTFVMRHSPLTAVRKKIRPDFAPPCINRLNFQNRWAIKATRTRTAA